MEPNETPTIGSEALPNVAEDFYGEEEAPKDEEAEVQASEETPPAETDETPAEEEGVEMSTVEELTTHYNLDPDWFKGLKIQTKINGELGEVSIADALASTQQRQAGDAYLADAKVRAKAMLEDANKQVQSVQGQMATNTKLLELLENQIDADRAATNWSQLRVDDPAEYAAKREDQRERREKLDGMKREAATAYQQLLTESQANAKKALEDSLPSQVESFEELLPDFTPEERASIPEYANKNGLSQQEIELLGYNARNLSFVVKAMRYDASKGKTEVLRKKVTKIPKILKSGGTSAEAQQKPVDTDDPVSILYGSN